MRGRSRYLLYALGDAAFIVGLYWAYESGDDTVRLWMVLLLLAYGLLTFYRSGFARAMFGIVRGSGTLGAILTFILYGALAPAANLIVSLYRFITYSDDERP